MTYELWEYASGHTFFPRDFEPAAYSERVRVLVAEEPAARQTWTVEASNYNEAMQRLYDYKGWGRYRTIEESLGEGRE